MAAGGGAHDGAGPSPADDLVRFQAQVRTHSQHTTRVALTPVLDHRPDITPDLFPTSRLTFFGRHSGPKAKSKGARVTKGHPSQVITVPKPSHPSLFARYPPSPPRPHTTRHPLVLTPPVTPRPHTTRRHLVRASPPLSTPHPPPVIVWPCYTKAECGPQRSEGARTWWRW